MFQEPEVLPPPGAAGSVLAPPQLQRSLTVSARASTCAQIQVARVELQAGRTLAGVVALSVGADTASFIDSGFPLTFIHICRGKERMLGACSCFLG